MSVSLTVSSTTRSAVSGDDGVSSPLNGNTRERETVDMIHILSPTAVSTILTYCAFHLMDAWTIER